MKPISSAENAIAQSIDQQRMLSRTQEWAAINSGTSNLDGLARMAGALGDAFSALPGDVTLHEPAAVTVVNEQGQKVEKQHGQHLVLSVRPDAQRRILLTGHMDTVFAADHPFQDQQWLEDDILNGPGTADMKGGIAIIAEALMALEFSSESSKIGL